MFRSHFVCGLTAVAMPILAATPVRAEFLAGDVLLNNFAGANIEQIAADGTLTQTFTGTGQFWVGASLTPEGNLVTVYRNIGSIVAGVNVLLPDGTEQTTFSFTNANPGDVAVFADGTIAVSAANYDRVDRYSPTGTPLGFIKTLGMDAPGGVAIGPDDTLWVANRSSFDLSHMAQDGTDLGGFPLPFSPGDVVVDPTDATLWVSDKDSGLLYHYSTAGVSLGSFPTGVSGDFQGLGIGSDGTLYVTGIGSSAILRYASDGTLLGSLPIDSPATPFRLTVVPVPEPAALVIAGIGLLGLAAVCRRASCRA